MGSSPRSPGFFAGLLDEISLYSCALADSEILAIYRAGSIGKAPAGNHGPVVNAGPNRRLITAPYTITLPGQISDDGLPAGASMRSLWSKRAGPGNVTFADSSAPITTASFDQPGFYQLQLKADDSLVAARDLVDVLVDGGTSLPPPAGLRAWWPGNFSPVEIINGIDAVAAGNATYGEGKVGGGFLFDGTGDYFRAPAASSLDVGTANGFTVETWIQPDDLIGRPLVEWDVPGYGVHFWSSVSFSGSLLANVVDSTGAFHAVQSPGNLLSTSQFQHVALTYDKILGITRLWLNGQKVAEAASGVFTPRTNGPLLIGGRLQGSPASFKGRMDEVGIYDRALSQAELQSLYNTGASGKTPVVHNTAPVANAGPDRTVTLPVAAILNGSVQDDGEPNNATPTLLWSQTDGPATANFASNNVAVTSVTFTAPGTYHFLLSATDGELSSTDSVEVVVSPDPRTPPVVSLVSPGAGSIVPASVPLSISATASDTDDNIAQVEFFLDNISAGTDSTAPYEVTVPSIAVGTHTVRAVATDESGLSAVSADRTIVAELPGLPLVSLNSPVEGARFIAGLAIDLGAQAATTIGNITRVEFLRDGIKFAEDTSAPFTSNMGGLAAGSYELTARAIASTGLSQTSTPVHIQVVNDPGGSPRLVLLTPEEAATVTGPTLFTGTVTTPILKSWHLDYRRKGDKCLGWTPFASGTSEVTAGELGTLDTTLLRNGIYEIQLVAVDLRNRGYGTPISTLVVDGGMKVGQFSVAFNDLTVSLAGIPITVTRTYDSRDNCPGDFGRGWNLDFNSVKLTKNLKLGESWFYDVQVNYNSFSTFSVEDDGPHVITITFPDGKTYRFAPEAKFSGRYAGQGGQLGNDTTRIFPWSTSDPFAISFKPMPGTHGTLEARGMPAALYMLDDFGGEIVWQSTPDDPFNGVVFDDASGFVFTAQNGSRFEFDAQGKLVKMTERNGNTLTFSRDGIFHSNGLSILFTRDAQERITKLTDPNGKEITYAYSAGGDLFSVSDRGGEVTTHTYDAQHELTGIIDPRGIPAVRNEYDAAGRLVKTTDADGKTMLYSHNIAGRREIITDRLGRSTTHVYDLRGNVTSSTDPLGHTTSTTYDAHDNKLSETNALGQTTTYRYDARDQMLEMRDALGNVTSFVYDAYGSPLSVTDPKGNVTSMTYDNRGNLASTTDALGNSTTYSYDTAGNRTGETNALNQTTTYRFNGLGHMTGMTDALGHVTSYTYDANGNQLTSSTTRTRADGTVETLTSTNVYDDDGRVVSTIDPDGISSATVYNEIGKTSVVTDKLGRETSMTYDRQGRPIRTTYPDGAYEEIGYDFEGKQVSRTDRAGHVSTSEYDAAGRLVKSIAPDGSFTQSVCDAVGRVTSIIDALGHTTTYSYDTAGRRTAVTNALGKTSRYTYDVNGNQLTFTDALGRVTSHVYDALNRRVATVFPDNTSTATGYDALGRRISETDQNGISKAFAYDALGRLVSVTDALNQVTSYTYDELGNQLTQTDANQHTTRYEYDRLGRRTKRILPLGMSESIGYDALGNMTARSDFNGKTTTYTYDALNRLTSRKPDASFGEPTVSYTYTPTGQRATMKDRFGTSTYSYELTAGSLPAEMA